MIAIVISVKNAKPCYRGTYEISNIRENTSRCGVLPTKPSHQRAPSGSISAILS